MECKFCNEPALGVVDVQPTRAYNYLVAFFKKKGLMDFFLHKKIAWTSFRCSIKHVDRNYGFLRKQANISSSLTSL